MIALAVIIPLVAYFMLASWLFDKYYWGTKVRLRKMLRLGVLSLPFLDVIIGFIIFGFLCLFSGGAQIYSTVDDVEAQKVYWFQKELFTVYKPSYSKKDIDIDNLEVPLSDRMGMININETLEQQVITYHGGYINHCQPEYDKLPESDSNYLSSCEYTDKIIQQYDIQNVILPPAKSPYYYRFADNKQRFSLGFFEFQRLQSKITNQETNAVLAVHNRYEAGGGWFFRLLDSFLYIGGGGGECCRDSGTAFEESVIPNPYKEANH